MRRPRNPIGRIAGLAALGVLLTAPAVVGTALGVGAATPCGSGDIVVSTTADSGAGSLRAAFAAANASSVGSVNTICVDTSTVTSPIQLSTGVLTYTGGLELDIRGNGATVQANGTSGIIAQTSGSNLVISDVTLTGGHADSGAAIHSGGGGEVSLTNSTIEGNVADEDGGGISANVANVFNSTIADNRAGEGGGGGFSVSTLKAVNSTITGNSDSVDIGGGASVFSSITLVYSTVTDNTGTQGANLQLNSESGTLTSFASVVTDPHGSTNCHQDATTSQGYNYSDDASCGFTATAQGDRQNASDPMLGALGNNGGPTATRLPATGSPLINAVPTASCQAGGASGITTDQRGVTRPQLGGCDIGSVEVEPAAPTTTTTTATTTSTAAPATPVTAAPAFTG